MKYFAVLMNNVAKKGTKKDGEKERNGRMRASHLECSSRYSARCLCARRSRVVSLLQNNVARCQRKRKRGSFAYCLKLLIGLRTDAAFPTLCSPFLFVSRSISLPRRNPAVYFPSRLLYLPSLRVALLRSYPTSSMLIVDDARTLPDRR